MKPTLVSVCLLGSLFALPVLADDSAATPAPAAASSTGAAPTTTAAASQGDGTATTPPPGFSSRPYHHRGGLPLAQVIYVGNGLEPAVVVDIPNGDGGLTPAQRAQIVAARFAASDKSTLQRLQPGKVNGEQVLKDPVTDKLIITADPACARFQGQKDVRRYVVMLQSTILDALSGYFSQKAGVPDGDLKTLADKHDRATLYRQWGDDDLEQGKKFGDSGTAEHLYTRAIALDPKYAAAYLSLCNLYLDANMMDKAKAVYQQAVSAGLDLKAEAQAIKSPEAVAMVEKLK